MKAHALAPIFYWPVLVLLPTSVILEIMEARLAYAAGGWDTYEFHDITIRLAISGGYDVFLVYMIAGSAIWLVAASTWVLKLRVRRKGRIKEGLVLLIGIVCHPVVFTRVLHLLLGSPPPPNW